MVSHAGKEAVSRRIRECARKVGSGDELARRSGVPRRTLESYLSGRSEPKATGLALIAQAAGVSLDWLLLGKEQNGANAAGPQPFPALPDSVVLSRVIETVEDWLVENGQALAPAKKADVIVLSYELVAVAMVTGHEASAMENIIRLLRLAS